MEQHMFMRLLLTGVLPLVLCVPRKYYLIQQGKTWNDAQAYCQAEHIDLAVIESDDNIVHLQNEAKKQCFNSSAWIGIYNDVNSWRWSMDNDPLGSMRPWCGGEPNNGNGHESCGVTSTSCWNDYSCSSAFPFLCFDGNKTGNSSYIYISNALPWLGAQSYCRFYYTDLASARNATENSIILGIITRGTWIGLFRDTWKWVDKSNFSTINWMSGKPNNAKGNQNCGYLSSGQAVDAQCTNTMPFFCYSLITGRQQIVRVKVQSNQEVNDSALKTAILEQITQTLMDHGVAENITLKWREKEDGQVFHNEKDNTIGE